MSCGPEVRFKEPQPVGKRNLNFIPKNYRGLYINLSDSSILRVSSDLITKEWDEISTLTKEEMQEEFDTILLHDTVMQFAENWYIDFKIHGDSTTIHSYGLDTIFFRSDSQLVRKYKGHLFLNYHNRDDLWGVKIMSNDKEYLDLKDLVSVSEIDSLKDIIAIDTIVDNSSSKIKQFLLKPNRREVEEILNRKKSSNEFKKI
jgi:hypothetical protein